MSRAWVLLLLGCSSVPPPEPELPETATLYELACDHAMEEPGEIDPEVFRQLIRDPRIRSIGVSLVEGEALHVRNVFGISLDVTPTLRNEGHRVMLDCILREGDALIDVGSRTIWMGAAVVWRLRGRLLILYVPAVE